MLFSTSLFAATRSEKNIKEGNWIIGGSGSYEKIAGNAEAYFLGLGPSYFIFDQLAIGLEGFYQKTNSLSQSAVSVESVEVGPTVRYFFYDCGDWASYINQSFLHKYRMLRFSSFPGTAENGAIATTSVGILYFMSSSIASGPSLSYSYELGNSELTDIESIRLGFSFSIYL